MPPASSAPSPMQRRPRARQGEGPRLRQELLDAAASLLSTTGNEDAVTLRAVAREVGIAAPSIYLHFSDRDELLRAVMVDCFVRFRDTLDAALAGADGPVAYAVLFSGIVHLRDGGAPCPADDVGSEPSGTVTAGTVPSGTVTAPL